MEINRLTITTESRILGDEYVRFGGEYIETCFHKGKQGALCLAIVFGLPAVNFSFVLPLFCFVLIFFYGRRAMHSQCRSAE